MTTECENVAEVIVVVCINVVAGTEVEYATVADIVRNVEVVTENNVIKTIRHRQ
jgi:hypothetical protein